MSDVWNVTAAYDKTSYNKGDTVKVSISGGDVLTTTTTSPGGTLTLTITAADGAKTTITVPPTSVAQTTSAPQSVKITSVTDTSGRIWAISADGLSATSVA